MDVKNRGLVPCHVNCSLIYLKESGDLNKVIRCRYEKDMTLKETGQTLGVTIEAVRQQQGKGLRIHK